MANTTSSLTRFSVKSPNSALNLAADSGTTPITRGKNKRIGIAVRLNHEDWHRASEFARREGTSLQQLLVAGISELMRQKGLPPLAGRIEPFYVEHLYAPQLVSSTTLPR